MREMCIGLMAVVALAWGLVGCGSSPSHPDGGAGAQTSEHVTGGDAAGTPEADTTPEAASQPEATPAPGYVEVTPKSILREILSGDEPYDVWVMRLSPHHGGAEDPDVVDLIADLHLPAAARGGLHAFVTGEDRPVGDENRAAALAFVLELAAESDRLSAGMPSPPAHRLAVQESNPLRHRVVVCVGREDKPLVWVALGPQPPMFRVPIIGIATSTYGGRQHRVPTTVLNTYTLTAPLLELANRAGELAVSHRMP